MMDAEPTGGKGGAGRGGTGSTVLCRTFASTGRCRFGDQCRFSHEAPAGQGDFGDGRRDGHGGFYSGGSCGGESGTDRPPCRDFAQTGRCRYGSHCRFAHGAPAGLTSPVATNRFGDQFSTPAPPVIGGGGGFVGSGGGGGFVGGGGGGGGAFGGGGGFVGGGGGGGFMGGGGGAFGSSAGARPPAHPACGSVLGAPQAGWGGGGAAGAASLGWGLPSPVRSGGAAFGGVPSPVRAVGTGFGASASVGRGGGASGGLAATSAGASWGRERSAPKPVSLPAATATLSATLAMDDDHTIVDAAGVSGEVLAQCRLSREQFDLFNAASFRFGGIPEIPPPEMLA